MAELYVAKFRSNECRWTLTHWGRVTHVCVSKINTVGSDNGLSPGRRQAIIWTNAGILLIGPLRTNFSEILSEIHSFSFKKMHFKMSSAKWRPFCLGLNELIMISQIFKNCQKLKSCNFARNFARDTPSDWIHFICIHMKWIQSELKAQQSGHGMRDGRMDGQTDGRTEWNQYPPPPPKKKKKKKKNRHVWIP